ncbi:MAG: hypothetical protein KGD64_14350 [Candidatus Heimdallarchaeota archaeon]|nr:hypothetical protein [Candidatus Heimdallarchaeota archaeon]
MQEITFQEYLEKSGQMLEKYRFNLFKLTTVRDEIEKKFFNPEEMVTYFYANKSEFYTWQTTQDSIVTLDDAYSELVGSMLDALGDKEAYKYYLKDQRIPTLVMIEDEEETKEDQENTDEDEDIDSLLEELKF